MDQKILWLVSIYPSILSPYDGDFVQRHARAVSLLREIEVIFVIKDEEGQVTNGEEEFVFRNKNLTERIVYYKPVRTGISILDKIISHVCYIRLYKRKINDYIKENGKPEFVHVHVAMKAGIPAMWLKKKMQIPFIVSEHWTGYLPVAKPNIDDLNFVFKRNYKRIFKHSSFITTVSRHLGESIKKRYGVDNEVIANVVDTEIFKPAKRQTNFVTKFIHISTNKIQKNTLQILEALVQVKRQGYPFEMVFYVPDRDRFELLINEYGLEEQVTVRSEVPQEILSKELANADALILFSTYETFGCVVIEANACGIPCILSDLEVFKEYSIENKTALFAESSDAMELARQIQYFIQNKDHFDKNKISEYTKNRFGYPVIARDFDKLYKKMERLINT